MTLIDRDRARVWHPYTQMQTAPPPLPVVRGEGVYLYTEDGQKILDGILRFERREERVLLVDALEVGEELVDRHPRGADGRGEVILSKR